MIHKTKRVIFQVVVFNAKNALIDHVVKMRLRTIGIRLTATKKQQSTQSLMLNHLVTKMQPLIACNTSKLALNRICRQEDNAVSVTEDGLESIVPYLCVGQRRTLMILNLLQMEKL